MPEQLVKEEIISYKKEIEFLIEKIEEIGNERKFEIKESAKGFFTLYCKTYHFF